MKHTVLPLPPSSPLYGDDDFGERSSDFEEHDDSPFVEENASLARHVMKTKQPKGMSILSSDTLQQRNLNLDYYPTPEPSSSVGNLGSSSPVHDHEDDLKRVKEGSKDYVSDVDEDEDDDEENLSDMDVSDRPDGPKMCEFNQPVNASYHTLSASKDHFVDVAKDTTKLKKTHSRRFKHIKLPREGQRVSLGRLSLCDVVLSDHKNLISRKHASVHYLRASDTIVFKCHGVNALEVQVPVQAKVRYGGERHQFELVPEDTAAYQRCAAMKYRDLVHRGITKFSRGLNDDSTGTSRFLVLPNEVLRVPRMGGMVVDIRGTVCAIEVADANDPDLTDEEDLPGVQPLRHRFVELSKDNEEEKPASETPAVLETKSEKQVGPQQTVLPQQIAQNTAKVPVTVQSSKSASEIKPQHKTPSLETKQIKKELVEQTEPRKDPLDPASLPSLNSSISLDKIKQIMGAAAPKKVGPLEKVSLPAKPEPHAANQKKRGRPPTISKLEEKDTKKPKTGYDFQDPKTLIDAVNKDEAKKQQLLLEIADLAGIKKVLVNHLALSRLALTPLSQLRAVSKKLEALDKHEIRLVLSDIRCVGVIYRKGKDAAGKPLDEEYYYDIEQDDDEERVQLINSVKGGSSLRSCRKTHKQYYWKRPPPLPRYY